MSKETKDSFKLKVLTSYVLTFSFLLASFSGVVLFLSPKGRIANWIVWTALGLDKEQWAALHMSFVAIMLISGLLHFFWFNWSVFLGYLRSKTTKVWRHKGELVIALVLTLLFWFGTVYEFPPAISITHLADAIDASYENEVNEPPIPHAEEFTLIQVAAMYADSSVDAVTQSLSRAGYAADVPEITLGELAAQYGVAPRDLLDAVSTDLKTGDAINATVSYHTAGQGKLTVKEYCELKGIELELGLARLKVNGFTNVRADKTLKEFAEEIQKSPSEVAKVLHTGQR
ncbi:DUF4405 domain-containing protein [bacterium]|nr:DUF4405 domain-containing protein [bacterium]MBU1638637.1 DUF4405 domain-containing protein [bacterium]MBU1919456.1 DUF4405 domain-containing protein [bacterium]